MAKKRLNKSHKQSLNSLVEEIVTIPEMAEKVKKAHEKTDKLFLTELEKIYPKHEIKILQKYKSTVLTTDIRFIAINNEAVHHSCHTLQNTIQIPRSDRYKSALQLEKESEAYQAMEAYQKIEWQYKDKLREKRADYYNLIESSRYFEDVTEIWEEAKQLKSEICGTSTALVAVSNESIARIKKDVAQRKQEKPNN